MSGKFPVSADRLIDLAANLMFWRCERCLFEWHDVELDLQNPPCGCGREAVFYVCIGSALESSRAAAMERARLRPPTWPADRREALGVAP